jgi:hypothetical protein
MADEDQLDKGKGRGRVFGWGGSAIGLVTRVLTWICLAFAAVLVVYVVLTVASANPDNAIVKLTRSWSEHLALSFKDLFTPQDGQLRVLLNYGTAAVFWLLVAGLVNRIGRRFRSIG